MPFTAPTYRKGGAPEPATTNSLETGGPVSELDMPFCECGGETDHDAAPAEHVTWPDGRTDILPACCYESDIPPRLIAESFDPIASIGYWNETGFPTAYVEASLSKVPELDDVYLRTQGDVDEQYDATYLRGPMRDAVQAWLIGSDTAHLPVEAVALADHYGLLSDVPDYDGAYPVRMFLPDEQDIYLSNFMISVSFSLPSDLMEELAAKWEEAGITWPREASSPGPARDAWLERLQRWLDGAA